MAARDTISVLIVEDNPDHLTLMEKALRSDLIGVEFSEAGSAAECLQVLEAVEPDVLIIDYRLPDTDGLTLLQQIRSDYPDLPILMVIGMGSEKVAVEALKSGATDYLIKSENYLQTLPAAVRHVLDHSRTKIRLEETEIYYKDLVENITDGIYLLDEGGKIRMVNAAAAQILGYERRQLIGRHFSSLFEPAEYKKIMRRFQRQPSRAIRRLETWLLGAGKKVPVEVSVIPVFRGNRLIGYQGVARDITDRIEAERERRRRSEEMERMNRELLEKNRQLQELDSLKTQFVSNVSHELRTPLNAILGYAELLKDELYGPLGEEQRKALQNIIASGNHLLNLINQLLDFALIQNRKLRLVREACSIYDLVDAALSTIRPAAEQKKLKLIRDVENNLPKIWADGQKIFQVLLNLLSNAVKFTERGEIGLRVRRKGEVVEFAIRDTGIGIEEEHKDRIFEDFHQASEGMSRKYGGAGLGLSLARHFVEMHGGKIWVESNPGQGATFYFTLPVDHRETDGEGTANEGEAGETGTRQERKG